MTARQLGLLFMSFAAASCASSAGARVNPDLKAGDNTITVTDPNSGLTTRYGLLGNQAPDGPAADDGQTASAVARDVDAILDGIIDAKLTGVSGQKPADRSR